MLEAFKLKRPTGKGYKMNLNNINNNLTTIDENIELNASNKVIGVKHALNVINVALQAQHVEGMTQRKAKKAVKAEILGDLDNDTNKHVLRAYNVAFTASFRSIELSDEACELPISQLENLLNYGTVDMIETLLEEVDADNIKAYLKSLKTREVTSKTFERKAK